MFFPFFYDPTFLILIPALLIATYAQFKVKRTFSEFSDKYSKSGLNGAEVAQRIMEDNGIRDVSVKQISGKLSDHYDPKEKVLNLSQKVYQSNSLASIGVAAHEAGHAIQDAKNYTPLGIRARLVPVASIGSSFGLPMAIVGFFLQTQFLIGLGFIMFAGAFLFHLVTLPVEFNASNRAIQQIRAGGYLSEQEIQGAKKVLRAAAFTYVAATLVALANLLRIFILFGMGSDD